MCIYCDDINCTLTKKQAIEKGPILEDNACSIMQNAWYDNPQTYAFDGVPAYYSLSALVPDEDEPDPHAYQRFVFDEDEGCESGWEWDEIPNPLSWQTEKEFLEKLERKKKNANNN